MSETTSGAPAAAGQGVERASDESLFVALQHELAKVGEESDTAPVIVSQGALRRLLELAAPEPMGERPCPDCDGDDVDCSTCASSGRIFEHGWPLQRRMRNRAARAIGVDPDETDENPALALLTALIYEGRGEAAVGPLQFCESVDGRPGLWLASDNPGEDTPALAYGDTATELLLDLARKARLATPTPS